MNFSSPRRLQWGWKVGRLVGFINLSNVRVDTSAAKFTASPSSIAAAPTVWLADNGNEYAPVTGRLLSELGRGPEVTLLNFSSRAWVSNGDAVVIGGIVVQENAPRTLLFRAIGPALASYDVANPLANPTLSVQRNQDQLATNDNWTSLAEETVALVPAFLHPSDHREAMLVLTIPPSY